MNKNIDYWESIVENPTLAYEEMFKVEKEYLQKNIISNSNVLDIGCGNGRNIKSRLIQFLSFHNLPH